MKLVVREFLTTTGRCPFREWLESLDVIARARIQALVLLFETGNLGDSKPVGGGVSEARFMFGSGYRIYYGTSGRTLVLLSGGDKHSQVRDIREARRFWTEYLGAMRDGEAKQGLE